MGSRKMNADETQSQSVVLKKPELLEQLLARRRADPRHYPLLTYAKLWSTRLFLGNLHTSAIIRIQLALQPSVSAGRKEETSSF